MAATNFSGPVVSAGGFTGDVTGDVTGNIVASSIQIPTYAATALADVDDAVNTADTKVAGTVVFDTTNSRLMIATGDAAADDWVAGDDSSTTVTPS